MYRVQIGIASYIHLPFRAVELCQARAAAVRIGKERLAVRRGRRDRRRLAGGHAAAKARLFE
eukprot:scaffold251340_cov36-Prasinocladus_malaysianus.AAC.2